MRGHGRSRVKNETDVQNHSRDQYGFTNPRLPDDLDVFSRPATYLSWRVESLDGKEHSVEIYFDATAELCVNKPEQEVIGDRANTKELDVLRLGTKEQNILGTSGDNVRIDWGYFIVAVEKGAAFLTFKWLSPHIKGPLV